jgi:hypothetical protein
MSDAQALNELASLRSKEICLAPDCLAGTIPCRRR